MQNMDKKGESMPERKREGELPDPAPFIPKSEKGATSAERTKKEWDMKEKEWEMRDKQEKKEIQDLKKERSPLEKEITIKIKPRKLIKWSVFILLLLAAFFLGRASTASFDLSFNISTIFTASEPVGDKTLALENKLGEKNASANASVKETKTTLSSATSASVKQNASNATTTNTSQTEVITAKKDEKVVTSYSLVSVTLGDVYKKWYDTWGKMTGFSFTIMNKEQGTIKPDYFIMIVEGYEDTEKKVPLSERSKSIYAGVTHESDVAIPNGFAYNQVTAGNLQNVQITIQLYDSSDKLIKATSKEVNLGE